MTAHPLIRSISVWLTAIALTVATAGPRLEAKSRIALPGRPGVICDERFSALRAQPDVKAPLEQRLRRGRVVGILGAANGNGGLRFLRIAVSRRTQGWVLAEAVVRPGRSGDAAKLMRLIEQTADDFNRARLARLCADQFRSSGAAPRALLILGEAAERAAERLTREARRRIADDDPPERRRLYFLNAPGLDRYNRIGITFDYDLGADRLVYDGAVYRQLQRRYPASPEAQRLKALNR
ncbi:MAG TPA: hypothetical protein VJ302_20680 [Blastocatellia bacterium]|nr:hypothetical protein [Blastocatellia bacterium]